MHLNNAWTTPIIIIRFINIVMIATVKLLVQMASMQFLAFNDN